ncbi:MAG: MMPL family transporter [Candidatus Bipolaricaulota bacterium]
MALFLALTGLSVLYVRDFPIRTAYLDLLPQEDPLVVEFQSVEQEMASTDVIAVLLTLSSPPQDLAARAEVLFAAAEKVINELDELGSPDIVSASYRVGEGIPTPAQLLIFRTLSPAEVDRLRQIAAEVQDRFPALPKTGSLEEVLAGLASAEFADPAAVRAALTDLAATGRSARNLLEGILAGQGLLAEAATITRAVRVRPAPEEIGEPILSRDRTRLILQVWPSRRAFESLPYNQRVTGVVRDAVARAGLDDLGVEAGITGTYVMTVEADEAIRRDMSLVTIISSAAVFGLIFLILMKPSLCLAAVVPVSLSALFTMAWAKFAVGGFNLLTVFLPALVLGLGDDFCIHILSRYVEERAKGQDVKTALGIAVRTKGGACLTAAATIAGVFSCLLLSHSRALWEMGVIMTVGILFTLAGALFLTPALVALTVRDRRPPRKRSIASTVLLHSVYRRFLHLRPGVVAVGLILTGALAYQASRVEFRFVSIQLAPVTPAQTVLATITREFSGEVWLGDSFRFFCEHPEDVRPLEEKLAAHPLVHSTASVRDLLPQELLRGEVSIWDLPVADVQRAVADLRERLGQWDTTLGRLQTLIVDLTQLELLAIVRGRPDLAEVLSQGVDDLVRLLWELEGVDEEEYRARLAEMATDLEELRLFVQAIEDLPPEPALLGQILAVLPVEVRSQYHTKSGQYVVEARMTRAIHEGRNLQTFLDWADGLDVERFGLPEVTARLEVYMKRDFLLSTVLAVLIIFLLVWRDFPRPVEAALALAPLGMGYVWMLAGMNLLGIQFNFTNIVISPLLIGIGVDSAVVLLHRVAEERVAGGDAVVRGAATTAIPIAFSSLTTMAAFGALLAAHTPGLRLLGTSALLGLGFTLLWSLTFLPAAIALLVEKTKPRE